MKRLIFCFAAFCVMCAPAFAGEKSPVLSFDQGSDLFTMTVTPDSSRLIAVVSGSSDLKVFLLSDGSFERDVSGYRMQLSAAEANGGSGLLFAGGGNVSVSEDNTVKAWKITDWSLAKEYKVWKDEFAGVRNLCVQPRGKSFAVVMEGGFGTPLQVFDVASGKRISSPGGYKDKLNGLAFSPDGAKLAAACWDGNVYLWDASSSAAPVVLRGHSAIVGDVAFVSPQTLVSVSADAKMKVWNTAGKCLRTLKDPSGSKMRFCAVQPGGRLAAYANRNNEIVTVDTALWQVKSRFAAHPGSVSRILFTPDGKYIISAGDDRQIKVWTAD